MSVFIFLMMPPPPDPHEIVGWEHIHQLTGLAKRTILDRKGGVKDIPLAQHKPLGWFRGHVDTWLQDRYERAQTPKRKALRLLSRKDRHSLS